MKGISPVTIENEWKETYDVYFFYCKCASFFSFISFHFSLPFFLYPHTYDAMYIEYREGKGMHFAERKEGSSEKKK